MSQSAVNRYLGRNAGSAPYTLAGWNAGKNARNLSMKAKRAIELKAWKASKDPMLMTTNPGYNPKQKKSNNNKNLKKPGIGSRFLNTRNSKTKVGNFIYNTYNVTKNAKKMVSKYALKNNGVKRPPHPWHPMTVVNEVNEERVSANNANHPFSLNTWHQPRNGKPSNLEAYHAQKNSNNDE